MAAVVWIAAIALSIYYCYDYSIGNVNFEPSQPVAFSHKAHIEKYGMKCTFCHYSAVYSDYSEIPATQNCMICHIAFRSETDLIKPLAASSDADSVIKWKRVYRLPDYVHFSHRVHLRAGVDCSSCHGEVEKLDSMKQQRTLTMKWCLDCHRNPQKFIVPARPVSGIYTEKNSVSKVNIYKSNMLTKPYFGKNSTASLRSVDGIPIPVRPARGSESCTSCHY